MWELLPVLSYSRTTFKGIAEQHECKAKIQEKECSYHCDRKEWSLCPRKNTVTEWNFLFIFSSLERQVSLWQCSLWEWSLKFLEKSNMTKKRLSALIISVVCINKLSVYGDSIFLWFFSAILGFHNILMNVMHLSETSQGVLRFYTEGNDSYSIFYKYQDGDNVLDWLRINLYIMIIYLYLVNIFEH